MLVDIKDFDRMKFNLSMYQLTLILVYHLKIPKTIHFWSNLNVHVYLKIYFKKLTYEIFMNQWLEIIITYVISFHLDVW